LTVSTRSRLYSRPEVRAIRIAYLIPQYPKISHTFIRREIEALERSGLPIVRIAMRGHETEALDPSDAAEGRKTRYILKAPLPEILWACAALFARAPRAFLATLASAIALGRRSDVGVSKHLAYFVEACVLRRWLEAEGVTHVHCHFGTNATAVALLCKQLGGPRYSFTVHGPEEWDRLPQIALREKIAGAQFVAAISSFCRSQLYRATRFSEWNKIEVVRCAIDPAYFSESTGAITEAPRLLCVGRLSEEKGQMLVVEAAALLAARGVKFEVVLAGDGPLRATLEEEIRRRGLEGRVRLAGWVDNQGVRAMLLDCRALVVGSFAEGLPVVIMEALAVNRPVVATSIAGIPELVENEVNGWLIPAGDVERLAEAMEKAITAAPGRLAEMGAAGRRRTFELHNADVEAAKLRRLFTAAPAEPTGGATPTV
jgi:colanic acid/amylovoran biosynthesis glycosyltransferase